MAIRACKAKACKNAFKAGGKGRRVHGLGGKTGVSIRPDSRNVLRNARRGKRGPGHQARLAAAIVFAAAAASTFAYPTVQE